MKIKNLRWVILSLIALVTIINYLDRGTLNYMWVANVTSKYEIAREFKPGMTNVAVADQTGTNYQLYDKNGSPMAIVPAAEATESNDGMLIYTKRGGIAKDLGFVDPTLDEAAQNKQAKEYLACITMCFMVAYGISQLVSGKIYDKIGTRRGFAISAIIWGLSDALTSMAVGIKSLSFFRITLGLGEAGPWPGTTKSNAEWFPTKERAFAQGVFGASASVGSVIAPVIIPLLYLYSGWHVTFMIVGSLGLLWVIPWLIINKKSPKEHPWITDQERELIESGQPKMVSIDDKPLSWGALLKDKNSYSVILGRFFLDPIWWMFVTWLPIYLMEVFHLDIKEIAMSAWIPYVGAAVGSLSGGWTSGALIKRGYPVLKARKVTMYIGCVIVLPSMVLAAYAQSALMAVTLMAFILGGFQFIITNIQTLACDLHTGKSVGSLAGLGGFSAVLGVLITMYLVPQLTTGGNWTLFFVMGAMLAPLSILSVMLSLRGHKPGAGDHCDGNCDYKQMN